MKKSRFSHVLGFVLTISVIGFSTFCFAQNNSTEGSDYSGKTFRYMALANSPDSTTIDKQALKEKLASATRIDDKPQRGVQSFISEYWVQFLALLVSLIGVFFAVTGFTFAGQKKKKSVAKFINQIDDTFASFKWKSKRCEAELYRIEDLIEDQLKSGKIDESSYDLLTKRIKKYLKEVQEIDDPIHNKKIAHHEKRLAKLAQEIEEE